MLNPGTEAPDFTLNDQNGTPRSLHEFRGKKVVLYFYPKDMTSGCTKQACGFAELYPHFQQKDAVVIGVSKDSVASHRKFTDKYGLPFVLLADPDTTVLQQYGVWQEKSMYGRSYMGVVRTTYLIDENGVIQKAMAKVNASSNPADMLALL